MLRVRPSRQEYLSDETIQVVERVFPHPTIAPEAWYSSRTVAVYRLNWHPIRTVSISGLMVVPVGMEKRNWRWRVPDSPIAMCVEILKWMQPTSEFSDSLCFSATLIRAKTGGDPHLFLGVPVATIARVPR